MVARLLSFSRAAVELNVSQSAVSHQIRLLEDFLGERLLLRQGRLLSLTAQGRSISKDLRRARPDCPEQRAAARRWRNADPARGLQLVCGEVADPRLAGLRQLYPELDLSLEMVAEDPELSDRVADCFITVSPRDPVICTICSIGSG